MAKHNEHHHEIGQAELSKLGKFAPVVLRYLQSRDTPQSAYDILAALHHEGAKAPMQIYRALDKLAEAGLVHKLAKSNGWIACDGHSHDIQNPLLLLLSCQNCGTVEEAEDDHLASAFSALSNKVKFTLQTQSVEIDGLCENCDRTDK